MMHRVSGLAIVVLVFAVGCSGAGEPAPAPNAPTNAPGIAPRDGIARNIADLAIGACFQDPGAEIVVARVDVVDCDSLHDFEVFAIVDLGSEARGFPGMDPLFEEVELGCIDAFPGYVRLDYLSSAYDFVAFAPDEQAWADGDRDGLCAIYEFAEDFSVIPVTGSARNAGR